MDLPKFSRTQFEIRWTDESITKTCGIQCDLTQQALHWDKHKSSVAKDILGLFGVCALPECNETRCLATCVRVRFPISALLKKKSTTIAQSCHFPLSYSATIRALLTNSSIAFVRGFPRFCGSS